MSRCENFFRMFYRLKSYGQKIVNKDSHSLKINWREACFESFQIFCRIETRDFRSSITFLMKKIYKTWIAHQINISTKFIRLDIDFKKLLSSFLVYIEEKLQPHICHVSLKLFEKIFKSSLCLKNQQARRMSIFKQWSIRNTIWRLFHASRVNLARTFRKNISWNSNFVEKIHSLFIFRVQYFLNKKESNLFENHFENLNFTLIIHVNTTLIEKFSKLILIKNIAFKLLIKNSFATNFIDIDRIASTNTDIFNFKRFIEFINTANSDVHHARSRLRIEEQNPRWNTFTLKRVDWKSWKEMSKKFTAWNQNLNTQKGNIWAKKQKRNNYKKI